MDLRSYLQLEEEPSLTWGNVLGVCIPACMLAALCVPCCVRRPCLCLPGWIVPHRTPIGFCTLHACCYRLCYCCACCPALKKIVVYHKSPLFVLREDYCYLPCTALCMLALAWLLLRIHRGPPLEAGLRPFDPATNAQAAQALFSSVREG